MKDWKPEESFGGMMILLGHLFHKSAQRDLDRKGIKGLNFSRVMVLSLLFRSKQSQIEIANILHQSPPSITGLLDRMEEESLITHSPDPSDRRKKIWELQSSGRSLLKDVYKTTRDSGMELDDSLISSGISKADLKTVQRVLFKMLRGAQK